MHKPLNNFVFLFRQKIVLLCKKIPVFVQGISTEKSFVNENDHCVKSVRIRSDSSPYSVRMRENMDQNNSEYGHFSHSG